MKNYFIVLFLLIANSRVISASEITDHSQLVSEDYLGPVLSFEDFIIDLLNLPYFASLSNFKTIILAYFYIPVSSVDGGVEVLKRETVAWSQSVDRIPLLLDGGASVFTISGPTITIVWMVGNFVITISAPIVAYLQDEVYRAKQILLMIEVYRSHPGEEIHPSLLKAIRWIKDIHPDMSPHQAIRGMEALCNKVLSDYEERGYRTYQGGQNLENYPSNDVLKIDE